VDPSTAGSSSAPHPGPPDDAAIRCVGVTKRFGDVVALDRLDLTVPRGAVVGFLGPNGAGKTTTMRILLDLARPDRGEVAVLGVAPQGRPELRRRIGYLPGEIRLEERATVAEILESWVRLRGVEVDHRHVDDLCERLQLDRSRHAHTLSSGNRRKVGLVGAFMSRPELLVLDEPTSGVDPLVQSAFLDLVRETTSAGATVFLSSHVLSEVQRVADDVVVIRGGTVVATGSVDEFRRRARQPFTVWFRDDPPLDELTAVTGMGELHVHGRHVDGEIEGGPNELIAVLARHPVEHLLLPEPDLEEAFLRLYDAADAADAADEARDVEGAT